MVLSYLHDETKKLLGQFVEGVAQELAIPYKSGGQTTWKRPEVNRGLESDESYFFRAEKLAAVIAAAKARKSGKIADYPNPDLGDRGRYLSVEDRPSGDLRRVEGRRGLAIRRRASKSSSSDWGRTDTYQQARGEPLPCRSGPTRSAGGWSRRTRATNPPGLAGSAPGSGPS